MPEAKRRMILSEFDHSPPEAVYVLVLSHQSPIKPTDLVVLTVGVVVPLLRAPDFISPKDHRYTPREHENRSEIFDLTLTQRFDRRIGCVALDSAIPAQVVIDAVAIVFPVPLVMFCVIGNQIVQRKTIVAGNEVDAVDGELAALLIKIGAPSQPAGDGTHDSRISFHKSADIIAVSAIPLGPPITREMSDLVQSCGIPCLCDHFRICQDLIQLDLPNDGRIGQGCSVFAARQNGSLIEAESIDVSFPNPVAKTIDDQFL